MSPETPPDQSRGNNGIANDHPVTPSRGPWFEKKFNLGQLAILLTALATLGAGVKIGAGIIWQGSELQATFRAGIDKEAALREEQTKAMNDRINDVVSQLREQHNDMLELTRVVMASLDPRNHTR